MASVPDTSHLNGVNYLFGYPIAHSLSPLLHQTLYEALKLQWSQILMESKDVQAFMHLTQDPKFFGASVTMPHKVAIIPYLDELTLEGQAVGAINTIFVRKKNGKRILCGTNTDCIGIREAITQNTTPTALQYIKGRPAVVIGGGGTCRAAIYALKKFIGCSPVYIVNRDKQEVETVMAGCWEGGFGEDLIHIEDKTQAAGFNPPAIIVSAIPDISPHTAAEYTVRNILNVVLEKGPRGVILEMCYHPRPVTEISRIAEAAGWRIISGTQAMIWQGLEQDRYWTGRELKDLPVDKVKQAISDALSR
ncbi:hypothetical protein MMC26_005724 [Xylographa opegraphella]|nr:hypothetical protein [Xylographa opegraphella]